MQSPRLPHRLGHSALPTRAGAAPIHVYICNCTYMYLCMYTHMIRMSFKFINTLCIHVAIYIFIHLHKQDPSCCRVSCCGLWYDTRKVLFVGSWKRDLKQQQQQQQWQKQQQQQKFRRAPHPKYRWYPSLNIASILRVRVRRIGVLRCWAFWV